MFWKSFKCLLEVELVLVRFGLSYRIEGLVGCLKGKENVGSKGN